MIDEIKQKDAYVRLVNFLNDRGVEYRSLDHSPEGKTDVISKIRGNSLSQAAKAMVVMVKINKKQKRYALVVVPGDCKLDFAGVAQALGGERVFFAPQEKAEQLTGCEMGAVPPFSFDPELLLIVDERLTQELEIVFNAARLDTSFFLKKDDYLRAARPKIARVAIAD
jgi:Ala-tRNA(Pro) deacylase